MRIAIHAGDLDANRIDGTRVYIKNILDHLGEISSEDFFVIGHRKKFNSSLEPKKFPNYEIFEKNFPFSWTQTLFAFEIWKRKPDALWMPMHNLPFMRRKKMKTIVTVHDLAFKIFPQHFTKKDLRKLNFLTDYAVKNSDKIIAVSESTKSDILKFYPEIEDGKIQVIYHGFDKDLFQKEIPIKESGDFLKTYNLKPKTYILYVGAIQPRKNLGVLLSAFEFVKEKNPELKLVLAGEKAWMWEDFVEAVEKSPFRNDVVLLGSIEFGNLPILYKNAKVFVFPSLYEGFGIPVLEAFACETPVILAKNSSLIEVGGDAVLYFETKNPQQLGKKIELIVSNPEISQELVLKGKERVENFSWEKCAKETLDFIRE